LVGQVLKMVGCRSRTVRLSSLLFVAHSMLTLRVFFPEADN
jgi:hypothetical protein